MIGGTLSQSLTTSPLYPFWHRCNDMVLSWLLNSMCSEIRDSVVYFGTAREIWEDLTVRFSQGNVPRIFQLKKELTALHQGSMSITAYFTKMRILTDKLNALAPIPKCVCAQNTCTCGVSAKLAAYEQINIISQFLMGFNEVYTGIRGQILMMQPLPTLSQAYSLLLQEENQRAAPVHNVSENVAMNVKFSGNKPKPIPYAKKNDSTKVCEYYHNSGHSQEKCFFLHGYIDWHRLHGKPKPKMRTGVTGAVKKVAQVSANVPDRPPPASTPSEVFSEAQCEKLTRMIQNNMKTMSNWSAGSQLSGSFS
ncbi:uncharacterized protein LOC141693675 [Apium graveolens]|uniref:uncharacterized protein LOC141693675 n=1 Tax=Apium graveolens TaxID=4045 RepID=UPI003D7B59BB